MKLVETLIVAFSMFSALPMPHLVWTKDNLRYALCAFPLVGAVIALACRGWMLLSAYLLLPALLRGAGLCLIPVLLTGGLHLDGYADTSDALASHGDIARRQEILKDPHIGSFAVIRLCCWFAADLALWSALPEAGLAALLGIFCLPRALSALALAVFPLRKGSGLARSFADASDRNTVKIFSALLSALLAAVLLLADAFPAAVAAAAVFLRYRQVAEKEFDGVSGDLAGWFVQKAELWMLFALCLWQFVEQRI